ncbi:MAG TPA: hypothetical protein QGF58_00675 [Myxococcota bacterium]|nr:hypothetical protein [Myxococcota bacterium]
MSVPVTPETADRLYVVGFHALIEDKEDLRGRYRIVGPGGTEDYEISFWATSSDYHDSVASSGSSPGTNDWVYFSTVLRAPNPVVASSATLTLTTDTDALRRRSLRLGARLPPPGPTQWRLRR